MNHLQKKTKQKKIKKLTVGGSTFLTKRLTSSDALNDSVLSVDCFRSVSKQKKN